ncbi:MAG: FMN-binding protein [Desulfobacterales bacterium]|nr:FMN-binding protein [Desulfobacterales bacterium]
MSNPVKSFFFAAAVCLVCSLLLTAASTGLKDYQQKNVAMDMQRNILKSVGLLDPKEKYDFDAINRLYARNIRQVRVDSSGQIVPGDKISPRDLPVYIFMKQDVVESYIVPVNTQGLWGKIHGYLAVKADGATVAGFSVYKHSETPGLGGEIESNWFQKNFIGKKIVDQQGKFVSVSVVKGTVQSQVPLEKQANYVDGISGASLTGKYLTAGLADILRGYEPVAIRFRQNRFKIEPAAGKP